MNICFISYGFDKKDFSESYTAYQLVKEVRKHHQVTVITKDYSQERYVKTLNIRTLLNNTRYYRQLKLDYFEFIYKAYQYLLPLQDRFDIIHHISPKSPRYPNPICNLAPKFIWGPLGGSIPYPSGFEKIEQRESLLTRIRKTDQLRLHYDPSLIYTFSNSDAVLLTSRATLDQVPPRFQHKSHIIPHGIENISYRDIKSTDEFDFLGKDFIYYCGRLVPYKGVELLLRAFAKYRQNPENKAILVIAGDGPELPMIQNIIAHHYLQGQVVLLGKVEKNNNLFFMSQSIFCVFPALKEAFGNVNLEAMALGKPIIVSDSGGPADIVDDGITGYKISVGSMDGYIDQLTEKIEILSKNVSLRNAMGRAAQKKVTESYTYDKVYRKINSVYNKIVR